MGSFRAPATLMFELFLFFGWIALALGYPQLIVWLEKPRPCPVCGYVMCICPRRKGMESHEPS